jgi:hypothetical protein
MVRVQPGRLADVMRRAEQALLKLDSEMILSSVSMEQARAKAYRAPCRLDSTCAGDSRRLTLCDLSAAREKSPGIHDSDRTDLLVRDAALAQVGDCIPYVE